VKLKILSTIYVGTGIILAILIISIAFIPSAFASNNAYDSGYDHGCDDAGISGPDDRYINQPGKGPSFHTDEFMNGYYYGFNSCGGGGDDNNDRRPQSPAPRQPGNFDWAQICSSLQIALVSSCDVLVNSDGTLTNEGERAVGCIRNGIVLAGGGSFLLLLPLPMIIAALQILEEPTGCDGIVQWGLIGSVGDLRSIINLLT
jgi:hypothetical protein